MWPKNPQLRKECFICILSKTIELEIKHIPYIFHLRWILKCHSLLHIIEQLTHLTPACLFSWLLLLEPFLCRLQLYSYKCNPHAGPICLSLPTPSFVNAVVCGAQGNLLYSPHIHKTQKKKAGKKVLWLDHWQMEDKGWYSHSSLLSQRPNHDIQESVVLSGPSLWHKFVLALPLSFHH